MLVVIGLIVGGVLTGQSLISAAEVRAQITQIEKYNSAVNTFRSKFNALPGDMRPELVSQFGFPYAANCDGTGIGGRNGDGQIDGASQRFNITNYGTLITMGETALFWQDISSAAAGKLIEGSFPGNNLFATCFSGSGSPINMLIPYAKIGHNNYVYVFEVNGINWFGVQYLQGGGGADRHKHSRHSGISN